MEYEGLEKELADYLEKLAEQNGAAVVDIAPDDSFFDKGILDSMSLLDFVVYLEKRYAIRIPGEDIVPENFGTLAAVASYLSRRR